MNGPNTLSNQWEILNRLRNYEVGMCSYITKAYYSLRTGKIENMCAVLFGVMVVRERHGKFLVSVLLALVIVLLQGS